MTDPSIAEARISPQIRAALSGPARRGQAAFGELLATARRESGLKPDAQNPRSSAAGLFQFTEQTWLDLVRRHGAKHGLRSESAKIVRDPATGRHDVPDGESRRAILALRNDPRAAAAMAGELTHANRRSLAAALGRAPTREEVYAAHFLGARGAVRLIRASEDNPDLPADRLMPAAARANRGVFRDAQAGRYRTAGELAEHLQVAQAKPANPVPGPEYLDGIAAARVFAQLAANAA